VANVGERFEDWKIKESGIGIVLVGNNSPKRCMSGIALQLDSVQNIASWPFPLPSLSRISSP